MASERALLPHKTILLVDDEEDLCQLIATYLRKQGYRVLTAGNVPGALKIAFAEFPDLVVTDVMMPGESGYSLCAKLKADPSTKDIPVMIFTVLDDEAQAMKVGAIAYVSKPIRGPELLKTIQEILKPGAARALLDQGLEQLRSGGIAEAAETFKRVLETERRGELGLWARYYLGQIHQHRGELDNARAVLRELLEVEPSFWRAHNRLGLINEAADDRGLALKHYRRSLAINPDQTDVQTKVSALDPQRS